MCSISQLVEVALSMLLIPIFPKLLPVVYVDMSVLREVGQACATAKVAAKTKVPEVFIS